MRIRTPGTIIRVSAEVNEAGFFEGSLRPKAGMTFHRNLTLLVSFATNSPKQSAQTLKILGPKGENLRGLENPQVFQTSGQYSGLQTLDRVPFCGEGLK
jgi:hypothetical protein